MLTPDLALAFVELATAVSVIATSAPATLKATGTAHLMDL
jgi:hypothetical protein